MTGRAIKRSFSGGEVAQTIPSRDDLAKAATSCVKMRNFIAQIHGSARNRPGFQYIDDALGKCVLLDFQFNTEEEDMYILVFSDQKIKIIQDDGYVVGAPEITSPYLESELYGIKYAQTGDVIYLVHVNHPPYKLVRTSHTTWSLTQVTFQSAIDPPTTSLSAVLSGTGGSFQQNYKVTSVSAKGEQSVGSASFGVSNANPLNNWTAGDYITLTWDAVTDAEEYNIYKEHQGQYGLVGVVTSPSFRDDNFTPQNSITPPINNNPFTGGNNPGAIAFHDQKLFFGGSKANPNTFYGSNIGGFENFTKSQPLASDDSVEFKIASGLNQIEWMTSFQELLIGTTGAELRARSLSGKAIGPTDIIVKGQSDWGSGNLQPLIVGNSVLHTERQSGSVRDLIYSLEKQGYAGSNLSVLAKHLFEGHKIIDWAFQQTPDSCVWAVRDDGVLLGMTYLREHEIWGWHVHETDGEFEAVTVIGGDTEDRLYVSINQEGTRRVAKLAKKWNKADGIEEAFYVDMGLTYRGTPVTGLSGLTHLEGKEVSILADGVPMSGTVEGGSVTLTGSASSIIHVGLPYTSVLAPLPFEADIQELGTTQGKVRGYGKVILRVLDTLGGEVAVGDVDSDPDDLLYDEIDYRQDLWDQAIQPYTGVLDTAPIGAEPAATIFVKQTKPLPMNILAMIMEVDFG